MGDSGEEIKEFEGTLAIKNGKPVVEVGDDVEKSRIREILQKEKVKITVNEEGENEKEKKCPFEPEKDYDRSFCSFLDQWLCEKVPGTEVSRADALVAVKMAKGEMPESEEEREKPKKEVR